MGKKTQIHFPVYALCIRRATADGGTQNGVLMVFFEMERNKIKSSQRRELKIKQEILKAHSIWHV